MMFVMLPSMINLGLWAHWLYTITGLVYWTAAAGLDYWTHSN